jgi:hypothetical protein
VGHLNELNDKYGTMGFTALGVTNEERALVDEFVSTLKPTYPIVIEGGDSMQAYGGSGFPSSFLIAPDGKIAWAGHPGAVSTDLIEDLLTHAKLFPDLPPPLVPIRKSMEKGKLHEAAEALAKQKADGKLSEEELPWADKLQGWLDWNRDSVTKRAAKAVEAGDFYTAWLAYETTAKRWKGAECAKEAEAAAKELLADKDKKAEIDAGKKLEKITRRLGDASPKKAIKQLEAMTTKKYADTVAGKRAAEMIKGYERELEALK